MRKLRFKEGTSLAQTHSCGKWWSWDSLGQRLQDPTAVHAKLGPQMQGNPLDSPLPCHPPRPPPPASTLLPPLHLIQPLPGRVPPPAAHPGCPPPSPLPPPLPLQQHRSHLVSSEAETASGSPRLFLSHSGRRCFTRFKVQAVPVAEMTQAHPLMSVSVPGTGQHFETR